MTVAFDVSANWMSDSVERRRLARLDLLEDVLEPRATSDHAGVAAATCVALPTLAGLGDGLGLALVGSDHEVVTGCGDVGQAEHLDRRRRTGLADLLTEIVDQRPHAAPRRAGNERVADIRTELEKGGIEADVYGRAKKPYSIWRKMQEKLCRAETSQTIVSPPHDSGTRPLSASWDSTRCGSAFSRSILLIATTIGTSAALAC